MPIIFFGFKFRSVLVNVLLALIVALTFVELLALSWPTAWFGAVNIVTFLLMGKDKLAATTNARRTPEAALLTMAMLGGFPGLFAGRKLFNHKTSKTGFILPMWGLFIAQLAIAAYFFSGMDSVDDMLAAIGVQKAQPAPQPAPTAQLAPAAPAPAVILLPTRQP